MRREWEPEDLVACWTLVEHDERELVAYKRGATRLGSSGDVGAAHHCRLYPLPHCRAPMIHAPFDINQCVTLAINLRAHYAKHTAAQHDSPIIPYYVR